MYKCNVCGHTQEEAAEHCGQPMVTAEEGSQEPAAPEPPFEPPSESSDEGAAM